MRNPDDAHPEDAPPLAERPIVLVMEVNPKVPGGLVYVTTITADAAEESEQANDALARQLGPGRYELYRKAGKNFKHLRNITVKGPEGPPTIV